MCARWGTDIGPVDRGLYDSLRALIGPELSFLCDYLGTVARFLAAVIPAVPVRIQL
jgi:retrograde regulation protein 2